MYTNIYRKMKTLAKVSAILGIVASTIIGLYCIVSGMIIGLGEDTGLLLFLSGFGIGIIGSVVSWISTWSIYAFADMGENIKDMRKKYCNKKQFTESYFEDEPTLQAPNYDLK